MVRANQIHSSAPRPRLLVSMYVYSYHWNKDPSVSKKIKKIKYIIYHFTKDIYQTMFKVHDITSTNSNKLVSPK